VLFGLWDLTASDGEGLVGAAATQPLDAGSGELCGIAIRPGLRRGTEVGWRYLAL
jgi:hypothetical protein